MFLLSVGLLHYTLIHVNPTSIFLNYNGAGWRPFIRIYYYGREWWPLFVYYNGTEMRPLFIIVGEVEGLHY
jgi:hypothetical protein